MGLGGGVVQLLPLLPSFLLDDNRSRFKIQDAPKNMDPDHVIIFSFFVRYIYLGAKTTREGECAWISPANSAEPSTAASASIANAPSTSRSA